MGNAAAKQADENTQVDGGFLFPTGTVYAKTDCDLRIVKRLILDRKMAPFYVGLEDEKAQDAVECPICFQTMPPNINMTRCCWQPMCTECFLQIRHPPSNGPAVCPFCVEPEFGVTYKPPAALPASPTSATESGEHIRAKSVPHTSPLVVTVDQVRPNVRRTMSVTARAAELVRRTTVTTTARIGTRTSGERRVEQGRPTRASSTVSAAARSMPNSAPQLQMASSYHAETHRAIFGQLLSASRDVAEELDQMLLMEAIRQSLAESNGGNAAQGIVVESDSDSDSSLYSLSSSSVSSVSSRAVSVFASDDGGD